MHDVASGHQVFGCSRQSSAMPAMLSAPIMACVTYRRRRKYQLSRGAEVLLGRLWQANLDPWVLGFSVSNRMCRTYDASHNSNWVALRVAPKTGSERHQSHPCRTSPATSCLCGHGPTPIIFHKYSAACRCLLCHLLQHHSPFKHFYRP
jgi:hypothetical protein